MTHSVAGGNTGGVLGPGAQRGISPYFTLPSWWGITNPDTGGVNDINYGDIRFPLSGAIAPDQYLPVAYGAVRVGGTVLRLTGITGQETYHGWGAIAWCEGEIQSIDKILCNGGEVAAGTTYNGGVKVVNSYTGTGTQYTQDNTSDLFCPAPRTNPAGAFGGPYDTRGLKTAAYTRLDLFEEASSGWLWWWLLPGANGLLEAPDFEWAADVHGLKIYDPRGGGSTAYSNNPVLIVRDILTRFGKQDVDDVSFAAMADAADTAGFTCNVVFAARTNIKDALAVVLQTCNGAIVPSNGKVGISLDIVNAGAAALTLSEADGDIWDLNYEWVSARDRITSLAIAFNDSSLEYHPNVTPAFEDPGVALGTVPLRAMTITAPGVNTLAAAIILRDYLFNSQAVTFRVTGTMNASGITLAPGSKVHLTSLKGIDADFIVLQVNGDQRGFFSFVVKPYSAAVYGTRPITQNPPVTNPPGTNPQAPPPPAAPRHQNPGMPPAGTSSGIAFDAPRIYTESGPYGAGDWVISGTGSSGDTSKINDGNTTVVAVTSTGTMTLHLDRGVVPAEVFGRLNFWIDVDLAYFFHYGSFTVEYSDDDITFTDARVSSAGWGQTTPWQDAPTGGIYPCHVEIPDSIGAHRYWRISFGGIGAEVGTLHLYEAQWDTFTAYTGTIVGYQIRTWPGGRYDGAYPNDLMDYTVPIATAPVVATLGTRPTDGAPYTAGDIAPLFEVVGDVFTGQASTFRGAFTTIGVNNSGSAVPHGARQVVAASASYLVSINADTAAAQTLVAGTNVTITDDGGGQHTINASGGGGSRENSSTTVDGVTVTFAFSTTVGAGDWIYADGRLMDETIGDYTRSTNHVTFASAPISTVKRMF